MLPFAFLPQILPSRYEPRGESWLVKPAVGLLQVVVDRDPEGGTGMEQWGRGGLRLPSHEGVPSPKKASRVSQTWGWRSQLSFSVQPADVQHGSRGEFALILLYFHVLPV